MSWIHSKARGWALALVCVAALAAVGGACGGASEATPANSELTNDGVPQGGEGGAAATSGLPCEVAAALANNACFDCHGSPLRGGAPMALLSYADLTAMSDEDPSVTVAARCVARMQDAASPMPPGAGVTADAADVAALQAWVDAGLPEGDCQTDPGPDPFDVPVACSSGQFWTLGDNEDYRKLMHPGRACNACHAEKEPGESQLIFSVAGTVYPTAHEPDECLSTSVGEAIVEITDRNGVVTTLKPNANGNFATRKSGFAYPYTAKVIVGDKERVMHAPQDDGDCNGCHTQDGTNDAPGRILLP
jgi:hypothetical protein